MTDNVTLTAATRGGLLSAQKTESLIERTSGRLSTGLKVSSVKDDAVAFFQARALNERAGDFVSIKDNISSGVSAIKAAMDGLSGVESLLNQMKGIALGAKSEPSPAKRFELYQQYDTTRSNLDTLAGDASYNGENLIGNPATDLTITLSPVDAHPQSTITIPGTTITAASLLVTERVFGVDANAYATLPADRDALDDWVANIARRTNFGASSAAVSTTATEVGLSATESLDPFGSGIGTPGYLGLTLDPSSGETPLDASNISAFGAHSAGAIQYQAALVIQDMMANGGTLGATVTDVPSGLAATAFTAANYPGSKLHVAAYPWDSVTNFAANIDQDISAVDSAITTVRSTMAEMGSNTAVLQIRIDYTQKLVNEMKQGASMLVNADLNEEGANLVSLQTRQQIGTMSLKFTGDSERGILSLFR